MFRIGDFARLNRISVRTLRHYDEIGLLKPVQVDEWTGYRYYSLDQLVQLNSILALKDLGLSLEQIGHLLKEGLSQAQLQGMLRLKQAELQQHIGEEQARLRRVESRLRQIEQEGTMSNYQLVIKQVEAQPIVSIRGSLANYDEMMPWFEHTYRQIDNWLAQSNVQPGPAMVLWYSFGDTDLELEAGYALTSSNLQPSDPIKVYSLPAGKVGSVIHRGSYMTIAEAYAALTPEWLAANGYSGQLPSREIVLEGRADPNDETAITELQYPLMLPSPPTPLPASGEGSFYLPLSVKEGHLFADFWANLLTLTLCEGLE